MMNGVYGSFSQEQIDKYKKILHKKIHWLLLYKDPNMKNQFPTVDVNKYFEYLLKEINGASVVLNYPVQIIEILSLLQAAYDESHKETYDWEVYRKLVLDAHNLVDKIGD